MQRFLKYTFPATNTQAVCKTQTLAAAGNLALDGLLTNSINSEVPFIKHGYSRNISFTSANNLSAVTFTIYGTQNGVNISETRTGPNNNTVYSTQIYDTITSISSSAAAAAVSVGTGVNGFVAININLETPIINYNTVVSNPGGRISTTIWVTLYDLSTLGKTYTQLLTVAGEYLFTETAAGLLSTYNPSETVANSLLVTITGNTGTTLDDTITVLFRQT